jgi:hypothetical protein
VRRLKDPLRSRRLPDLRFEDLGPPSNLIGVLSANALLMSAVGIKSWFDSYNFLDVGEHDTLSRLLGGKLIGDIARRIGRKWSPACRAEDRYLQIIGTGILAPIPPDKMKAATEILMGACATCDMDRMFTELATLIGLRLPEWDEKYLAPFHAERFKAQKS